MADYDWRPEYKSRAERQIADFLVGRRIPFIYEKPTAVMDGSKLKIWYPDFSLQYGVLIEYFGVVGSRDYTDKARHKLRVYHDNHLDVIPLYPSDMIPQWRDNLLRRLESILDGRMRDLRRG